jgi:DUF1009 family protein
MNKLGLIAGGGALPISLATHCRSIGRPLFIVRLKGIADQALNAFEGVDSGLAELGKGFAALRRAGCASVCLAGRVDRPDFSQLRPDLRGLAALPGAIRAARRGDDGLLGFLIGEFEKEGFAVEGAHEVMETLTLGHGSAGRHAPGAGDMADIRRAFEAARAIGRLDIGQGAVACDGLVLAVEAQEGTDAMLRRISELPQALRGSAARRRGVLAKAPKPGQDRRVDLPTIGPETVRRAAAAHLAGIAGEAGQILILRRDETLELADEAGLFIFGLDSASA